MKTMKQEFLEYYWDGNEWLVKTKIHSTIVYFDKDNKKHRADGPASIYSDGSRITKKYYKRGDLSDKNNPSSVEYDLYGNVVREVFMSKNAIHREGKKPAEIKYHFNGRIKELKYYNKYSLENGDDPSFISYRPDGTLKIVKYTHKDSLHRLGGPAYIKYNQSGNIIQENYHQHGRCTREDTTFPSVIKYDNFGSKTYMKYFDYQGTPHRDNGPAEIGYNNGEVIHFKYYYYGKLHRLDGPAIYDKRSNFFRYVINNKQININSYEDIDFENWPLSIEEQTILQMSI